MFPTTHWTAIQQAGESDPAALERFATTYRTPVLAYVRAYGFGEAEAEDLCQDVFVRILRGDVLAKADPRRGRFRQLLSVISRRVVFDRLKKGGGRADKALGELEPEAPADVEFDRLFAHALLEQALVRLRSVAPGHYETLRERLEGGSPERRRLWKARRRLAELLRFEVARVCASPQECEDELRHLAPWLTAQ